MCTHFAHKWARKPHMTGGNFIRWARDRAQDASRQDVCRNSQNASRSLTTSPANRREQEIFGGTAIRIKARHRNVTTVSDPVGRVSQGLNHLSSFLIAMFSRQDLANNKRSVAKDRLLHSLKNVRLEVFNINFYQVNLHRV